MLSSLLPLLALPLAAQALIDFPADNRMVQEPGLLRYPLDISAGAPGKRRHRKVKRQSDVDVNPEKTGYFYSIELQIGTPAQAVRVNFDTGSSELWVNPVCSKSTDPAFCEKFGRFNGSQTFVNTGATTRINYGTGFADLDYGYDYVQIGSAKISQQMFGVATDSEFAVTGILGAGPALNGWTHDYPVVLDNMVAQGYIKSRAFALDIRSLESKRGSVVFGGIDTKKFSGPLEKRPIIPATQSPDKLTRYWVYLDGVSVTKEDGSKTVVFDQVNAQPVLLDSGYTVSSLPTKYFNKIKDAFPDVTPPEDASGLYRVSCNVGAKKGSVNFKFGKTEINVPYDDFIWKQPQNNLCVLGVVPDDEFPVLGDTFLRAAYVVYDQDNRNIHIANNEDCGSALLAIGKGPDAVPSVVGDCGKPATTSSSVASTTSTTSSSVASTTSKTSVASTTSTSSSSVASATSTASSSVASATSTASSSVASTTLTSSVAPTTTAAATSATVPTGNDSTVISSAPSTTAAPTSIGGNSSTDITSQPLTSKPVSTTAWQNTTAPPTYTSTYITTKVHTVTACPPYVTACPIGHVTTETITGTTTWCPGNPTAQPTSEVETQKPIVTAPPSITSVFTTTKVHTITSCSGQGACNAGQVTTEVITSTTYLCPESTAVITIPQPHTCREGDSGCNPGDVTTTMLTVTVEPHTTADLPTPAPGCGDNCVLPPPAPTQPPAVTTKPSVNLPGTISGLTTIARPTETPCSTCVPQPSAPVTAGAAGFHVPAVASVMIVAALAMIL